MTYRVCGTVQQGAGPAVTAYCYPGDNLMVHKALDLAQPGQIVVLSNGGGHQGALLGEMMGNYILKKGIAGVVVFGPIRDVDALREMRLPIWATQISASHPERRGPGSVNVPMNCAGVWIRPGDIVVADGDGVVAIAPSDFDAAIQQAHKRAIREAAIIAAVGEGRHLYDVSGAREIFETLGIQEVDDDWTTDTATMR